MDQLQPQPEVITSSLVRINSTSGQISALAALQLLPWNALHTEEQQVDWLILHFNYWFSHHNVMLVRGEFEPEYFPATDTSPARIQFAHGFLTAPCMKSAIGRLPVKSVACWLIWDTGMLQMDGQESSKPCSNRLKLNRRQLNGFLPQLLAASFGSL